MIDIKTYKIYLGSSFWLLLQIDNWYGWPFIMSFFLSYRISFLFSFLFQKPVFWISIKSVKIKALLIPLHLAKFSPIHWFWTMGNNPSGDREREDLVVVVQLLRNITFYLVTIFSREMRKWPRIDHSESGIRMETHVWVVLLLSSQPRSLARLGFMCIEQFIILSLASQWEEAVVWFWDENCNVVA